MKFPLLPFHNRQGATLVELMMMLAVVSLTLMTMFVTLSQSINFAQNTEARIRAINIAREWVEALVNIRNTNWLRFSSNRESCWDTLNYNGTCINSSSSSSSSSNNNNDNNNDNDNDKLKKRDYNIFQGNGLWKLENDPNIQFYPVYIDEKWWYTTKMQPPITNNCKNIVGGGTSAENTNCKTIFSRKVTIKEKEGNFLKAQVEVRWFLHRQESVTLEITLTNWKKHYDETFQSQTP